MVTRMHEAERSRLDPEATIYRGGSTRNAGEFAYPEGGVLELILILTF
jgi:hypothetical protein